MANMYLESALPKLSSFPSPPQHTAWPSLRSYMYLAIALSKLDDQDNACSAYEKAISLAAEPGEPLFHLNYAVLLQSQGSIDLAKAHLAQFHELYDTGIEDSTAHVDPDVGEQALRLGQRLAAAM
eukprot:365471-Chlamydomonas_euryale.AAC.5